MASVQPEIDVECPICCEDQDNPRLLDCGHSFCFQCLVRLLHAESVLKCPTCRKVTERELGDLPRNIYINRLIEVKKSTKIAINTTNTSPVESNRTSSKVTKEFPTKPSTKTAAAELKKPSTKTAAAEPTKPSTKTSPKESANSSKASMTKTLPAKSDRASGKESGKGSSASSSASSALSPDRSRGHPNIRDELRWLATDVAVGSSADGSDAIAAAAAATASMAAVAAAALAAVGAVSMDDMESLHQPRQPRQFGPEDVVGASGESFLRSLESLETTLEALGRRQEEQKTSRKRESS